jgi:hypothetical protein
MAQGRPRRRVRRHHTPRPPRAVVTRRRPGEVPAGPLTPGQRARVESWLPAMAPLIRRAQARHPSLRDDLQSDVHWALCVLAIDAPDADAPLAVVRARTTLANTIRRGHRHLLLAPDDLRAADRLPGPRRFPPYRATLDDFAAPAGPGHGPVDAADWLAARGPALIPADLAALRAAHAGGSHAGVAAARGVSPGMISHRCRRGLALLRARAAAES